MTNVTFINTVIDDHIDEIEFQTYDNVVAGSGDREDGEINNVRGWGNTLKLYRLKTTKLKDIHNIDSVNALVIDMEGGELKFLKTLTSFITTHINKLCIELHGHMMKQGKIFDNDCKRTIKQMGFTEIKRMGNTYYF